MDFLGSSSKTQYVGSPSSSVVASLPPGDNFTFQQTLVQSPNTTQVLASDVHTEMYVTTQYMSSPTMMDLGLGSSTTTEYVASPTASVRAPLTAVASDSTSD